MKTAAISTVAMMVGRSPAWTASTAVRPSPWRPKVVSVITVPPSAPPTSSPAMVTIGVIAARSACRPYTLGFGQALGPRGADEVLRQRLQHLRPGQPGVDRGEQEGQRHPGAAPARCAHFDRVVEDATCSCGTGSDPQVVDEDQQQHRADEVELHRGAGQREADREPVQQRAPAQRRDHAEADAEHQPEDRRRDARCSASPAAPGRWCR